MDSAKFIRKVFLVIGIMMLAGILYSVLLEYPSSTVLTRLNNTYVSLSNLSDEIRSGDAGNTVTDDDGNIVSDNARVKSALWYATEAFQRPFGQYYHLYCQIPNERADEQALLSLPKGTSGVFTNQLTESNVSTGSRFKDDALKVVKMSYNNGINRDTVEEDDDELAQGPSDDDNYDIDLSQPEAFEDETMTYPNSDNFFTTGWE